MKIKPHCGPAFPFNYHNQTLKYQESFVTESLIAPDGAEQYMGVSMRDYFAAAAMQGMLAACATNGLVHTFEEIAGNAFYMADEMLRAGGHFQ